MEIINILISSIMQVILFSMIPFLWWIIFSRKQIGFFKWIGFTKPKIKSKKVYGTLFIVTAILFSFMAFILIPMFSNTTELATSQFAGQGGAGMISALIYAFIQTGLSEEIFFRGFLGKRLANKFGFAFGNTVQALLFGLLHGVMLFSAVGVGKAIIIIAFTGVIGWVMGYINERQSDGSIISSWCLHGIGNTISSIISLFSLL